MKFIQIITALSLMVVASGINGVAGYLYMYGGAAKGAIGITSDFVINKDGIKAKDPSKPHIIIESDDKGNISTKSKGYPSFSSLILLNDIGVFGGFLLILSWFQFIAGIILLAVKKMGLYIIICLAATSVLGVLAELIGFSYTNVFSVINIVGIFISMLLGLNAIFLYKQSKRYISNEL